MVPEDVEGVFTWKTTGSVSINGHIIDSFLSGRQHILGAKVFKSTNLSQAWINLGYTKLHLIYCLMVQARVIVIIKRALLPIIASVNDPITSMIV